MVEEKNKQELEEKKENLAKPIEKVEEKKPETKKEEKKITIKKKNYALVKGFNLGISPKDSISVCNMIRDRTLDNAEKMLNEVTQFKRVIKMNNREVPHKHGKGVMAGRYPMNVVKEFIRLVKQLRANALHNELELEKYVIFCKSDRASRPYKRGGAKFKRANILLRLEKKKENKINNKAEEKK